MNRIAAAAAAREVSALTTDRQAEEATVETIFFFNGTNEKTNILYLKIGLSSSTFTKKHLQIDFSVSVVRYTLCRNVCWSTILANLDLNRATNLN